MNPLDPSPGVTFARATLQSSAGTYPFHIVDPDNPSRVLCGGLTISATTQLESSVAVRSRCKKCQR
ncbi:MAG: hypothetical protein AAGA68_26990, partial [Pseudomonadota bacterium]